jgi:hypothetical protein
MKSDEKQFDKLQCVCAAFRLPALQCDTHDVVKPRAEYLSIER